MKKRLILLTAAVLTAGLSACQPKTEETAPSVSIEETAEETSDGAAQGGQESSGQESAGELGSESSRPGGAQPGQEAQTADEKLNEIHSAIKEAYGDNYIPSMEFDGTMLKEVYGIEGDWYEAALAEGPMISAHVETFIGIRAKEGKAADVAKALETYRKNQLEEALQYPMNMPKIEASQVAVHGDYVFFVMLGGASQDAEEQGEEAALESAKENNQIAMDVIDRFFQS